MPPIPIFISAGEASGDMYAAQLAAALRERADVQLFGMGGPRMREAGVELIADCAEVSLVGIVEILQKLPALNRVWDRLLAECNLRKPRIAILTDFPGFHLRLARALKPRGVQNIYFVCPQFWAWRPWRANLVRRRFTLGLCIFPFEKEWYAKYGARVEFIGHPLVGHVAPTQTRDAFAAAHGLDPSQPIITVLPGSRPGEIARHMPILVEACRRIREKRQAQFVVALAPGMQRTAIAHYLDARVPMTVLEDVTYDAVAAAAAAIVSSGTATIETALLNTPMVVVYRLAPLTAAIAKWLVRTRTFAMVNLIAGQRIVPELIQNDFTAERVANEVLRLLDSPDERTRMREALATVREKLGAPGAIDRAADRILELLTADSPQLVPGTDTSNSKG